MILSGEVGALDRGMEGVGVRGNLNITWSTS